MLERKFFKMLVLLALGLLLVPGILFAQEKVVNIVLNGKNFTSVDWPQDNTEASIPYTWRGCKAEDVMSRLNTVKPDAVTALPKFQGTEQLYGYLKLGNFPDNRFYFVMDVLAPDKMLMYFDFNHNGRLDDDGAPLPNTGEAIKPGEAGFATYLAIPWEKLIVDSPFQGNFKVWFFINNFQWENKGFSHSSHTFLRGMIDLNGVAHTIYMHDQAENDNDADLTNDGFYLKIEEGKTRYISKEEAQNGVTIDNNLYKFNIAYGNGS
ncbi:MAG: hypothetical protein HQL24_06655 [Candidatus Omnitrophica bacterium]|nr:hypothetical protein [Candidatus Omnitrophota bacterium]